MRFTASVRLTTALVLSGSLILTTQMATTAQASMVSTDTVLSRYAAHADRQFLLDELQKEEVRRQIIEAGADPVEAEKRLMALSDEEVAALARQIEDGTAGGSSIVGALLTVFIILLVTDLLCLTKVFPFTRCAR